MSPAIALLMLVTSAVVPIAQGITSPEHKSQKRTKAMEAETDANSLGLDVKTGGHIVSHLENGNEDFDEAASGAAQLLLSNMTPSFEELEDSTRQKNDQAWSTWNCQRRRSWGSCTSMRRRWSGAMPEALPKLDDYDAWSPKGRWCSSNYGERISPVEKLAHECDQDTQCKGIWWVRGWHAGKKCAEASFGGTKHKDQECAAKVVTAPTTPAPSPSSNEVVGDIRFHKGGNGNGITGEAFSAEWNKFWTKDEGVNGLKWVDGPKHMYRPEYVKFKSCTGNECEDCQSDAACGWKRYDFGEFTHLDTADDKVHVAEYWMDCVSTQASSWVLELEDDRRTKGTGRSCDLRMGYTPCEEGAFQNADIKVYLAEKGGHMQGDLQAPTTTFADGHKIVWNLRVPETGSMRLYVVIKAKGVSKKIQVGMRINVLNVPNFVDDCMAHKMCVNNMSDEGSARLRNNNTLQLQCLKNEVSGDADCNSWTNCLDANPAHKDILQAILEAGLPQTSGTLLAEREETPNGEVTGECAHPAHDDPESWECECSAALYEACFYRWADLAACIEEKMCASNKVCANWKQDKGCPGFLLSEANLSLQESQPVMRSFPDGTSLQGQGEDQQAASMEESLAGKRSC